MAYEIGAVFLLLLEPRASLRTMDLPWLIAVVAAAHYEEVPAGVRFEEAMAVSAGSAPGRVTRSRLSLAASVWAPAIWTLAGEEDEPMTLGKLKIAKCRVFRDVNNALTVTS